MSTTKAPLQKTLKKALVLFKKKYGTPAKRPALNVLEALVMAILGEGSINSRVSTVFSRLKNDYFDWNEVRVSAVQELVEVFAGLPDAEVKASRVRGALKYGFETTYSFDFDVWRKGKLKETTKKLSKLAWASDYVVARLARDGLGGHAIPLDAPALRVLARLELAETPVADLEQLRGKLERVIPKSRSTEFTHYLSVHAHETCLDADPHCKQCILVDICPFGQHRLKETAGNGKSGRGRSSRS